MLLECAIVRRKQPAAFFIAIFCLVFRSAKPRSSIRYAEPRVENRLVLACLLVKFKLLNLLVFEFVSF